MSNLHPTAEALARAETRVKAAKATLARALADRSKARDARDEAIRAENVDQGHAALAARYGVSEGTIRYVRRAA